MGKNARKGFLIGFLCLTLFVLCGKTEIVSAETSGDWEYQIYTAYGKDSAATCVNITKYNGDAVSVRVPASIDGYPVKKLSRTFRRNETVNHVIIPKGVEDLDFTFYACDSIRSVSLPSTIKNYNGAFAYSGIASVTLQEGTYPLVAAFQGCTNLETAIINGTVTDLRHTFSGCTRLSDVRIDKYQKENSTWTLQETFLECQSLKSAALPEGVSYIYPSTFEKCISLKTVYLPKTISGVGGFPYCYKLKDIYYPGTKSQWKAMTKDNVSVEGDKIKQAKVHYKYSGEPASGGGAAELKFFAVKLKKNSFIYSGTAYKPKVKVYANGKKIKRKYYKVNYRNNKNAGLAAAIVTGKGKYSGYVGINYFAINLKKPVISAIKTGSGRAKVKWKKDKQASGFEIQYSTSKKFDTDVQTIAVDNRRDITISGLVSGKKYYVRIRSYKNVYGSRMYSAWSRKKKCRVK